MSATTGAKGFPKTGVTLKQVERAEAHFSEQIEWARLNPVGMRMGIVNIAEALVDSDHVVIPRSLVDALGELVDIVENAADYLVTHEGGGYPAETVALVKSWFAEESK